eukprot:g15028.t1
MALAELMPHFPSRAERQSKRSRSAVEVGWTYEGSYGYDEREGQAPRAVRAKSWDEFVRLKELIVEVMRRLAPQLSLDEERLNVSCLLYSPGQCIPWHADRHRSGTGFAWMGRKPHDVAHSDSVLEFHQMEPQGKPTGRPLERFLVPEEAGCCFLQQHEARYQWIHGVPELHRGERLSVTWRWFLDDDPPPALRQKMPPPPQAQVDPANMGPPRLWHRQQGNAPGLAMSRGLGDALGKACGLSPEATTLEMELNEDACDGRVTTRNEEDVVIVLGSDGIFDVLSDAEILHCCRQFIEKRSATEAAAAVTQSARQQWLQRGPYVDDCTCVVLFL